MISRSYQGYSLLELLIVVGMLSMIAAIAAPSFSEDTDKPLNDATNAVAEAFRFAHAEAIRTGDSYGVNANYFSQTIKVYRRDESDAIVYDVIDPMTKQLYTLTFGTEEYAATLPFLYIKYKSSIIPSSYLNYAAETGVPSIYAFGTTYLLETAYVRTGHNGQTREVHVSPITGRVTLQ